MKDDGGFMFFLILIGLGGLAFWLWKRSQTTTATDKLPPQPSTCDKLLGTGASAIATAEGAPIKINAPAGSCTQYSRIGSGIVKDAIHIFTSPVSTAKGISSGSVKLVSEVFGGGDFSPDKPGTTYAGACKDGKITTNQGWRAQQTCANVNGKVATVVGGGNFHGNVA